MSGLGLRAGVRLVFDEARGQHALLQPEGVSLLNETAADVVSLCDGQRDAAGIVSALGEIYEDVDSVAVTGLINDLLTAQILHLGGQSAQAQSLPGAIRESAPFGLLAELTYKCPLQCAYCSNPLELNTSELDTQTWLRVISEARELGVLQLHLSGGEPLSRRDLPELVVHARRLGLYTNLITSGIGLSEPRLHELVAAGLDHVQLSIQDSTVADADAIAGIKAHTRKVAAAALITEVGLPLSINVVLHRHNVDRVGDIARLAASLGAQRLELAHTQYYGWGLLNRAALMPTAEQIAAADLAVAELALDDIAVVYVRPDYHDSYPKPCMNGWGTRQLVVAPDGRVLPCPAASVIPGLGVANVASESLEHAWYDSDAFNRFRGTSWMSSPCRECPRRELDYGGCRCQAYQLTGDAAATDPVCSLSPQHHLVPSTTMIISSGESDDRPSSRHLRRWWLSTVELCMCPVHAPAVTRRGSAAGLRGR